MLASTSTVRLPRERKPTARFTASVVVPTPPLGLNTVINLPRLGLASPPAALACVEAAATTVEGTALGACWVWARVSLIARRSVSRLNGAVKKRRAPAAILCCRAAVSGAAPYMITGARGKCVVSAWHMARAPSRAAGKTFSKIRSGWRGRIISGLAEEGATCLGRCPAEAQYASILRMASASSSMISMTNCCVCVTFSPSGDAPHLYRAVYVCEEPMRYSR